MLEKRIPFSLSTLTPTYPLRLARTNIDVAMKLPTHKNSAPVVCCKRSLRTGTRHDATPDEGAGDGQGRTLTGPWHPPSLPDQKNCPEARALGLLAADPRKRARRRESNNRKRQRNSAPSGAMQCSRAEQEANHQLVAAYCKMWSSPPPDSGAFVARQRLVSRVQQRRRIQIPGRSL